MDSSPPMLNYRVSVAREGTNMFNSYTTSGTETSLEIPGSDFRFFDRMATKVTFPIFDCVLLFNSEKECYTVKPLLGSGNTQSGV